jgi:hypothetical protein
MDQRQYPEGRTPFYSQYVSGVLKFFKRATAVEFFAIDGTNGVAYEAGKTYTSFTAATLANINTGATLIAAVPGYKIRLLDVIMVATGANLTTVTSVDIKGTQGTAKVLLAMAVGGLVRSTVNTPTTATHAAPIADGFLFKVCDVNTAITVLKAGTDAAASATVDITLTYELVRA